MKDARQKMGAPIRRLLGYLIRLVLRKWLGIIDTARNPGGFGHD